MTMAVGAMQAGPSTSASSTIDPVRPAGGFLVVTEGDTTLASHESEGPIAIGGDLTVAGQYQVIAASGSTYPGDPAPTSLLVGGALRLEAGQLHVNQGTAHIGDLGALEIVGNGNITHVVPPGGDEGTTRQVKVQARVRIPYGLPG